MIISAHLYIARDALVELVAPIARVSVDVTDEDEEIFSRDRLADLVRSNEEQLVVLRSNLKRFPGRLPASHVFTRAGLDQWLQLKGTHPIERDRALNVGDIVPLPASVRAQMLRNVTARQDGAGPSTQPQGRDDDDRNENLNRAIAASLANQGRPQDAVSLAEQEQLDLAMQRSLENSRKRRRSNSNTNDDIPIAWRRRS